MKHLNPYNSISDYSIPDYSVKDYSVKNAPKIGDFILFIVDDDIKYKIVDFLNNNIGEVIGYLKEKNEIQVKYDNIPENLKKDWFIKGFDNGEIIYVKNLIVSNTATYIWTSSKEELEAKLASKKYNI